MFLRTISPFYAPSRQSVIFPIHAFRFNGATLTLTGCTVSGNACAAGNGGGIFNGATLTLTDCNVSGNTASTTGGGILTTNTADLTATGCTFSGNVGANNGGAVSIGNSAAAFTNCTFSGNSQTAANSQGGGAVNFASGAISATFTHCTFTGNTCAGSEGGGALRVKGVGVRLAYCLLSGNTASGGTGPDLYTSADLIFTGANIVAAAIGGGGSTSDPAPITTAPTLGALASNGGRTQTCALLTGSPSGIDAATGSALSTDQRGSARVDGDVNGSTIADLGAYEASAPIVVTSTADTGAGSLRQALSAASSAPGPDVITFALAAGSVVGLTADLAIADSGGVTLQTAVSGGAVDVAVNAGTLSFGGVLSWTGGGRLLLGNTTGSAAATVDLAGPDGFTLAAPITVRGGSSGVKMLRASSPANTYAGDITLLDPATVDGTNVTWAIEHIFFTGKMDLGAHLLTVNANEEVHFTGQVGRFDGTGTAQVVKTGYRYLILEGSADNPRLAVTVLDGFLALYKMSSASVHALGSGLPAGTTALTVGADLPLSSGGDQIANDASVTLDGYFYLDASETLDALTGSGVVNMKYSSITLTLGAGNGSGSFAGTLEQPYSLPEYPSLTKTGTGTQTLSGNSGMTGAVLVSGGTLNVTGSLMRSSGVTVQSGATLAGTVTMGQTGIVPAVTLASGGALAPGDATMAGSIGMLLVNGDTKWNGGGTVRSHLGATGASADRLNTSALTKGSAGSFTFDFQNTGTAGQTYTLATFASSTFTAADFTASNLPAGLVHLFTMTASSLTVSLVAYTGIVANNANTGSGSLREMIILAAAHPGPDTITFAPGFTGPIVLGSEIVITSPITLDASAVSGGVTIDGGSGNNRLFTVNSGQTVALKGLFLTSGDIGQGSDGGGAIYNNGSLALTLCTLAGNSATGSGGGAIINFGTLTLAQCTLVNNSTTNGGGAIDNRGALALTQCTLTDNSATNGGALSGGGTLTNCTLVDNMASGIGGAVDVDGPVTLRHCTVVGNSAGGTLSGRGVHVGNGQVLALENSIVSGNTGAGGGADIYNRGTVNASGTNIVRTAIINAGASSSLTGAATIAYVDPLLAGLGSHGGPTQTMPPMLGSPAIDQAGARAPQVLNDQRGAQRPLGPRPDIGAVEADIITVTTSADELDDPRILGAGLSLREAVRDVPAGGTVVFDRAVFTGATATTNALTLARGPLNPQRDCTLDGSANPGGITILTLLPITQQPQSLSVGSGTPLAFSVNVTNASGGVSYQWWKDGVVLDGKNLAGYTISSAGETDEGAYEVTLGEAAAPGALTLVNVVKPAASGRSQSATLTVDGSPVTIRRHPAHAMLALGSSHTLSVAATGPATPALTYQWLKNEVKITGATSSTYVIPSAALTHAGSYTCEVKSSTAVGAPSNAAEIAVVDTRPMTVNLTSTSFTATVSAAGSNLSLVWKRNDNVLPTNSRSFTMNSNSPILLAAGLYTCTVTGPGGVITNGFNTQLNLISNAPILVTPLQLPVATIGQAYYYQIPVQPTPSRTATSFSVSGTLPTGITLNTTTGVLSGRPTVTRPAGYPLTFRATNIRGSSEAAAATLMVNAVPANAVGTFAGPAEISPLNDNLGGRLDLTTTTTGLCSGGVTLGARAKISFANQLLLSDGANDLILRATLSGITMADKTPLAASLEIFVLEQVARLTLTHPNGNSLIIPAWRNAWNSTTNKATAYAAYYTARLDAGTGSAASPEGYGYASFTVSTAGALTVAGKLPDGSGLTGGTFVGANGEVLLFNLLYANRGSIVGQFNLTAVTPTIDNMLGGSFSWFKPGPKPPLALLTSTDTVYKAGFGPLPLNVVAEGGVYVPPAKGQRVMGLLTVPNPNARLSFTLGSLAPDFTQALNIVNPSATGLTNTAVVTAPITNTTRLTTMDAAKGFFNGSFQINGATAALHRPAPFEGMIVKIGASTQGCGYFLLPTIPVAPKTVNHIAQAKWPCADRRAIDPGRLNELTHACGCNQNSGVAFHTHFVVVKVGRASLCLPHAQARRLSQSLHAGPLQRRNHDHL
jgi:autotransporter-associated beta strand protein